MIKYFPIKFKQLLTQYEKTALSLLDYRNACIVQHKPPLTDNCPPWLLEHNRFTREYTLVARQCSIVARLRQRMRCKGDGRRSAHTLPQCKIERWQGNIRSQIQRTCRLPPAQRRKDTHLRRDIGEDEGCSAQIQTYNRGKGG